MVMHRISYSRRAGSLLLPVLLCALMIASATCATQAQAPPARRALAPQSGSRQSAVVTSPALEEVLGAAQTAQNASQFAEAAALYAKATKLEPDLAELWANRGLMEHLAGQPQTALVSFQRALKLKPELFTPLLFSARDQIALNKPELALSLLDRAAALQPENPDVAFSRAHAEAALGKHREEADAYEKATQLQPQNPAAWFGLAVASLSSIDTDGAALARGHAHSAWAQALYADELLTQGRLTEGTKLYKELVTSSAPQDRCKLLRMLEYRDKDDLATLTPEAKAALKDALHADLDVCRCDETSITAACAYLTGNTAASLRLAAKTPASTEPELLYWSIKSNERQTVLALSRFQDLSPQSPATFDLTGDLYRRQSIPDRALAEYEKALTIDPHDPAALLGSAAALLSENHSDEALTFAKRGLADRPVDLKLNLAAAEALVSQHRFDEAKPHLDICLHGSGDSAAFAHALMGRVAAANSETEMAIRELRLGLSTDQDGSLHYQLFRLLRKMGDTAGANAAEAQARALVQQRMAHAATAMQNMQEVSPN